MGRKNRQTQVFPFKGKGVKFYQPTDGQMAMMHVATADKSETGRGVLLLFDVIKALVVQDKDWDMMESSLVSGDASLSDFSDTVVLIFSHEWPEETSSGEE